MEFPKKDNYIDKLSEIFPDRKVLNSKTIIDDDDDKFSRDVHSIIIEDQKQYTWVRVYLKDEDTLLDQGDIIHIKYVDSGEEITTIFACYNKKGLVKDEDDEIREYNPDDDKKVLCLMVDMQDINSENSEEIPFIRTLFPDSPNFEYQLLRRGELEIICKDKDISFDYIDIDF